MSMKTGPSQPHQNHRLRYELTNFLGSPGLVKHTWLLLLIVIICQLSQNSYKVSAELTPEIIEALRNVIDYYNKSMNLAESVEMVEKYYELARDEGIFRPARIRLAPEEMIKISEDLDKVERNLNKQIEDNRVIDRLEIRDELQAIQKRLEWNYGPEDKNFRIIATDPMAQNMKAVKRMKEHWDVLMADLTEYAKVQLKVFKSAKTIQDTIGISLYPEGESNFILLQNEEQVGQLMKTYKKSDDFVEANFNDIAFIFPKNRPKQTSQEIQALQDAMNGLEVDPVSKNLLQGFIPELNKKTIFIISKLQGLEETIKVIEEEGDNYGFYYMDKREELYNQLNNLKKMAPVQSDEHEEL